MKTLTTNFKQVSSFYRYCNLFEKQLDQLNTFSCSKYTSLKLCSTQPETKNEKADEIQANLKNYVNPLRKPDFFGVNDLFTIKDLFDAKVHFGHKTDTLNPKMRSYIFGSRMGHLIFDLEQTASLLRAALNFTAHIAYRDGVILFASNYHQHCPIIEQTAIDCKEFAHTRTFRVGLFTNSTNVFDGTIRFPDLVILTSTLNTILQSHQLVFEAAKLNIPTIGIVDSNSDPTIITYPVPGNDDTPCTIELYCKLFKTAILKGKEYRKEELKLYGA